MKILKLIFNTGKTVFQKMDKINVDVFESLANYFFEIKTDYANKNIYPNKNGRHIYQMNTHGVIVRIN